VTSAFESTRTVAVSRIERLAGQHAQQRALERQLLSDRARPARDPPREITLAALEQQRVELRDRIEGR